MGGIWRRWFGALILALVLAAVVATPASASAPPLPANCGGTTSNVADAVVVPVPTGPAVATSTINVAGAGTSLRDVDVLTSLQHTFAADIDMTVTSPAGTIVTLTTDNGAGNDNVFDGTRWDDQADANDPAGQVPYTTNQGLANDHLYADLTPVPAMAPEEPLAAFNGEDPNGTWTLTISDDLVGDGGSLNGWSLDLSTVVGAQTTAEAPVTEGTDVPVPTMPAVVTSTMNVAGARPYLSDLDLLVTLPHTFAADIDMTLMSPAGTVVTLTTDNGAGFDNVFAGTRFDVDADPAGAVPYTANDGVVTDHTYVNLMTATPLTPEESFGAFTGENPNGTWTLTISDDLAGDGGTLDQWTLEPTTAFCVPPPAPINPTGGAGQVAGKAKKCKKRKGRKGAVAAKKKCKKKKKKKKKK